MGCGLRAQDLPATFNPNPNLGFKVSGLELELRDPNFFESHDSYGLYPQYRELRVQGFAFGY